MSVRPILLQKDGAIKGIPGAYRNSPPPIAGPYAGSDALEDVTYYTVNASGEAELKTVKAYPFYCDSVSGGLDTSGDGTLSNPWRSVNQALTMIQPILACLSVKSCCTYLVLRVKGTVDYSFYTGSSVFNGYDRLIIEPWDAAQIYIDFSYVGISLLDKISYCILKNFNINISATFTYAFYTKSMIGGSGINRITFNNMNVKFTGAFSQTVEIGYWNYVYVFYGCSSCIFYQCSIELDIYNTGDTYPTNHIFRGCGYSIFYEVDCTAKINFENKGSAIIGFFENNSSSFYSCNLSFIATSGTDYPAIIAWGFYNNAGCAFNTCVASAELYGSNDNGCGFYQNPNPAFLNCTGYSINRTDCDI